MEEKILHGRHRALSLPPCTLSLHHNFPPGAQQEKNRSCTEPGPAVPQPLTTPIPPSSPFLTRSRSRRISKLYSVKRMPSHFTAPTFLPSITSGSFLTARRGGPASSAWWPLSAFCTLPAWESAEKCSQLALDHASFRAREREGAGDCIILAEASGRGSSHGRVVQRCRKVKWLKRRSLHPGSNSSVVHSVSL